MDNLALRYGRFGEPGSVLQPDMSSPGPLMPGCLRVQMLFSPVNASDIIPITGAYRHRTPLPTVAGYEGVGVVIDAPEEAVHLLGKRVLPLRGQGTWQRYVDCPLRMAIPVPDDIHSHLAARAYINPLAAQLMLTHYPSAGKRVLLTAAGSDCAILLGQWARRLGAETVYGIHRSAIHADRLAALGIIPISQNETATIRAIAAQSDRVYDATGGRLAEEILNAMPEEGVFICYGILSGQPFRQQHARPRVEWFHIRNYLDTLSVEEWQAAFRQIWSRLRTSHYSEATLFPLTEWQAALTFYREAGRFSKPLLSMGL